MGITHLYYFLYIIRCLLSTYLFPGSKMLALFVVVLAISTVSIQAWDIDQMEVFDLVEEMNNINFYQFLEVSEVSIVYITLHSMYN